MSTLFVNNIVGNSIRHRKKCKVAAYSVQDCVIMQTKSIAQDKYRKTCKYLMQIQLVVELCTSRSPFELKVVDTAKNVTDNSKLKLVKVCQQRLK